jgi:hypothetical protein
MRTMSHLCNIFGGKPPESAFRESTAMTNTYPSASGFPGELSCGTHFLQGPAISLDRFPAPSCGVDILHGPGQPLGRSPASPSPCRQNENGARRPRFPVPTRLRSERVLHAQRVVVDVAGVIGINIHETRVSQRALAEVVDTHNFHGLVLVSCILSCRRHS